MVRSDPNCYIELDENVDHRQYLIAQLDKLREGKMEAPASTTYDKVKPIIKEVFESYYALAIKYIKDEAING